MNGDCTPIAKDIAVISGIAIVPSILDVICRTTGMGFACIARVTEDKWVACSVKDEVSFGLQPGGELQLDTTICNEIRQHKEPVVINEVATDPVYAQHHTPRIYGLQSYISYPIILKDGSFFGTLCAIDAKPADLNNSQIRGMFTCFVDLIAVHINNIREKTISEAALAEEKEIAQLREGFIAILGHDLRNPVSAILTSAQLMTKLDPFNEGLIKVIENSATRINKLIDTMLDLARGRLAGGIGTQPTLANNLQWTLQEVLDELATIWPNREIDIHWSLTQPVLVDNGRIAQMFSNLLGNALKYGTADLPVRVSVMSDKRLFEIAVSNAGKKISKETLDVLFKPFSRGAHPQDKPGLGLGLYIAAEIARAHNGAIHVTSSDAETKFVFSMPVG